MMTLSQLVQLYAPLAGLLGVVFWLGMLTQQVRTLKEDMKEIRIEDGPGGSRERLVRLEVQMENAANKLESIERGMQGVQRQLGNLMMKPGRVEEFGASER